MERLTAVLRSLGIEHLFHQGPLADFLKEITILATIKITIRSHYCLSRQV